MAVVETGPWFNGMALTATLIVAVGAQNAYVLAHAVGNVHIWLIAGVCVAIDVLMISLGVLSGGAVVAAGGLWADLLMAAGVAFLLGYGLRAFWAAVRPQALMPTEFLAAGPRAAVAGTLAVSLLNPHMYMDTFVLIGSAAAAYPVGERLSFAAGGITGSLLWFTILAAGGRLLAPCFARPASWRLLNALVAITMWAIAWQWGGQLISAAEP